jgi:hypothetical protein
VHRASPVIVTSTTMMCSAPGWFATNSSVPGRARGHRAFILRVNRLTLGSTQVREFLRPPDRGSPLPRKGCWRGRTRDGPGGRRNDDQPPWGSRVHNGAIPPFARRTPCTVGALRPTGTAASAYGGSDLRSALRPRSTRLQSPPVAPVGAERPQTSELFRSVAGGRIVRSDDGCTRIAYGGGLQVGRRERAPPRIFEVQSPAGTSRDGLYPLSLESCTIRVRSRVRGCGLRRGSKGCMDSWEGPSRCRRASQHF